MWSGCDVGGTSHLKQMANMISFRDILVHDYMKVDEEIILDGFSYPSIDIIAS